jgi:SAM-dependent methyltransferase
MNSNRDFAVDSPDAFERERLTLLTEFADPITIRRLTDIGVQPGWRCLDVGAGEGSVARWLSGCVGPSGRVVATDLNPRFLVGHWLPNLVVRRHNILEDELETDQYDLVHCRCVLQHLSDPLLALRRLAEAVRPGGWLLVEEIDVGCLGAADSGHPRAPAFNRRIRALWGALRKSGPIDPHFGRRLPSLVEGCGLRELGHNGVTVTGRGGDPMAWFLRMSDRLLRDHLVAAGALTEADFTELARTFDDPSFWFVGVTLFGAWGRRLGGHGSHQQSEATRRSTTYRIRKAAPDDTHLPAGRRPADHLR